MRKLREILRLKWVLGKSHRATASSVRVSTGMVGEVVGRARRAELSWELVEQLTDAELEARLYSRPPQPSANRPTPDLARIDLELRKPGVTMELLHMEYVQAHPDGYSYSRFCSLYRAWRQRQRLSMRQSHRAGEKLFVDYSGKKPHVIEPATGEVREVELFVAVLGASNYTYAEATWTQSSKDWIASHIRALEYLGGVPGAIVPDQLKSGVVRACRYEPVVQRTYEEMARHYGTAIVPARPRKPRDKAKVEVGVQVVQRWILARLRHEQFFSLAALNRRIHALLVELAHRPMRIYGGVTRQELFDTLERPALRSLPAERFVYSTWKDVRVNIDYHVEVDKHYYSVPYTLAHEVLEARLTATTVELFHQGTRVAAHARGIAPGRYTTITAHLPKAHQKHLEWTPSRLVTWAATLGPSVEAMVRAILDDRPHPEQGYRSCLGIMRLEKSYGAERVDAACQRALRVGARSYRHVATILKNKLEHEPLPGEVSAERISVTHENVRGPGYYH